MINWIKRIAGILMVIVASLSMLLSLYYLGKVWQGRQPMSSNLELTFELFSTTLDTTDQALLVVEQTLGSIDSSMTVLVSTTLSLGQSVNDTSMLAGSVSKLFGEEIPTAITSTQISLDAAQESALVIDNVLTTLSKIPLIGIQYQPAVPLNTGIAQISTSLAPLSSSLKEISSNLETTSSNLLTLQTEIMTIAGNIDRINQDLSKAQEVIDQYQAQIDQFQTRVNQAKEAIPTLVTSGAWIFTFIILWLVISQAGLLMQGLVLFKTSLCQEPGNGTVPEQDVI